MRRTRSSSLALAVVALAVGATGAFVLHGGSPASAVAASPRFAVSARAATATDALPGRRVSIASVVARMPGVLPATARLVHRDDRVSIALVRRDDGQVCLVRSQGDGAGGILCAEAADASARGVAVMAPGQGYGVVPAGTRAVDFRLEGGRVVRAVPDASGFYRAPRDAVRGTLRAADGSARGTIPFTPASALPEGARVDPYGNVRVPVGR